MSFQVINALKIIKISYSPNFGFLAWIQDARARPSLSPLTSRDPDIKPTFQIFDKGSRELFWTLPKILIKRVVVRSDWSKEKVAIVSGGGSGHEPFAAGLVGKGGITGAVCGSVFASPPAGSVLAALREVTGPAGCMLVVFNYTGDRINFSLAANRAKAEGKSLKSLFIFKGINWISREYY